MSVSSKYILDANIFIEARQRYYPFDLCPGFWDCLVQQHEQRCVFSIDKVRAELIPLRDDLSDWVRDTAPDTLFKGTADRSVIEAYSDIVQWVQSQPQYTPAARSEFSQAADGWVIAYAKSNKMTVVTHEEYSREAKNRVKIPNICLEFGVPMCNTFEMLRDLGARFVLQRRSKA